MYTRSVRSAYDNTYSSLAVTTAERGVEHGLFSMQLETMEDTEKKKQMSRGKRKGTREKRGKTNTDFFFLVSAGGGASCLTAKLFATLPVFFPLHFVYCSPVYV